jgi:hypothetical protein
MAYPAIEAAQAYTPFWFFFIKKKKILLFLKKNKQKDFCAWCWATRARQAMLC